MSPQKGGQTTDAVKYIIHAECSIFSHLCVREYCIVIGNAIIIIMQILKHNLPSVKIAAQITISSIKNRDEKWDENRDENQDENPSSNDKKLGKQGKRKDTKITKINKLKKRG